MKVFTRILINKIQSGIESVIPLIMNQYYIIEVSQRYWVSGRIVIMITFWFLTGQRGSFYTLEINSNTLGLVIIFPYLIQCKEDNKLQQ